MDSPVTPSSSMYQCFFIAPILKEVPKITKANSLIGARESAIAVLLYIGTPKAKITVENTSNLTSMIPKKVPPRKRACSARKT